jgi:release factor glutamine methyltransferase
MKQGPAPLPLVGDTVVIARQHVLPSFTWLADQVIERGLCSRVLVIGKPYSSVPTVDLGPKVERHTFESIVSLLPAISSRIIALDDGGQLQTLLSDAGLADRCCGVEQTSFGVRRKWLYPTVLVCRSAAKLYFESQIIARGIYRKLESLRLLDLEPIGVLGMGALGSAIVRLLLRNGRRVFGADKGLVPVDLEPYRLRTDQLVHRCPLLLGCVGRDALAACDLSDLTGDKVWVSCSSADVEFGFLVRQFPATNAFDTVRARAGHACVSIPNGGYPINFDREHEWEHFAEIKLTRMLLLQALTQAEPLLGTRATGHMLDPDAQLRIVREWLSIVPDLDQLDVPSSLDESFFRDHSEGEYNMSEHPIYTLHHTTPNALDQMRAHNSEYEVSIAGVPIVVHPNVWSPRYDWSSLFYVENMCDVAGRSFLEIGSGTGVISVFAAKAGATRVVAVDINPDAVKNTAANFDRHDVRNGTALLSNGFDKVTGHFDVVTWNAPYHGSKPNDMLERGCADEGYRDIRAFFAKVGDYLTPGGLVVFGFSESGDLELAESLMHDHGFRITKRLSDWRDNYNCMLFELRKSTDVNGV